MDKLLFTIERADNMNTESIGTVGIYVRVSTMEQVEEGYSIAAQKERLKAYCKAQGWTDYKFYVDEGVSAKDLKRPQLQKLFEHIEEGKIKLILVYRLDRFTRSVRDLHKMLEVMDKHGCGFKSATEVYDTVTAMGRLFITIVAALAEWETSNSSERIKMALEKKVSDGERVGAIPYGFDLSDDEKLIKNDKSEVVLDIINKFKSGMSPNAIARHLTATNDDKATWFPNAISRLLKNPAIYGATRWNDNVYENTHEGIITKDEFIKLQEMLKDRAIHVRREIATTHLFQGVIVCPDCKQRLTVNRYLRKLKDGTKFQSAIYRCKKCYEDGKPTNTPGERSFLKALYEYMEIVKIEKDEAPVPIDKSYQLLKDELKAIERKREKFQKGWASDLIGDEEFSKLMDGTRSIYEELKDKVVRYKPEIAMDSADLKELVLAFNVGFKKLTTHEKRAFVSEYIREIHYKSVPQPPKNPRYKKGKPLLIVTNVLFH